MGAEMLFDPAVISGFPTSPGVYLMKNAAGEVIYVGKASNLRNRVRNYFTVTGDSRFSVVFLRRQVASIDYVVTVNEKEAFILENTLIKQHHPRYNIRLRDDKTYISLRFNMSHPYPRLEVVRVRRHENLSRNSRDIYFGPYTSSGAVRQVLRFLLRIFPVRTCKDSYFRNRTRPCMLYDVGKCCGPCTLPVSREDYAALVDKVTKFLKGRDEEIRQTLEERMYELSDRMEFEKAAMVRDRLAAIDETLEKQRAAVLRRGACDVIGVASNRGRSLVVVQQYRNGVLTDTSEYYVRNYEHEDSEVLYSFISQHYGEMREPPEEVLVSVEPEDMALLQDWLAEQRGMSVSLYQPQRGDKLKLVETSLLNARDRLELKLSGESTLEETLDEVMHRLELPEQPRVIECVDISNIMGVMAVGSLVRFRDAQPDKTGYRMFKIRTVEGSNDFAMMREVLLRRFSPENRVRLGRPDLLMLDGGKGQLGVAEGVFQELGIEGVALASIAKSRLKTHPPGRRPATMAPEAGNVRYRTEERIFRPGRKNPITFAPNSPGLHMLQNLRDEAHRFAITYHKKLRAAANRRSVLDEVPGIGPTRKKQILRHFGSLAALKAASVEAIAEVPGLNPAMAGAVYHFLHTQAPVQPDFLETMPEDDGAE